MRSESWRGNCRKDAWESYIQLSGGSIWLWCSCLNPGNPRSLGGRGGFLETSSGRPPGGTHSPHSPGIQCLVLGVKSAVDERETWRWHEKTKIVRFYFWHERTDAVFTKFHLCGISGTGYFIETESRLGVGDQGLGEGVMGSLCFMRTELLFGGGDKLRKQMLVTWLTVVCIVNAAELHTKNFSNGRLLTKIFIEWKKKTKTLQWGLLHSEALFQGIRPSGSWGGWASVSFPFQEDKSSLPSEGGARILAPTLLFIAARPRGARPRESYRCQTGSDSDWHMWFLRTQRVMPNRLNMEIVCSLHLDSKNNPEAPK